MKATGIVRRIDDLGRIVIPKEMRRTLRIREGELLEIFTNNKSEVILKKFSPMGEISDYAIGICESLTEILGHTACIVDRDRVIAVSGIGSKEIKDKLITTELEDVLNERKKTKGEYTKEVEFFKDLESSFSPKHYLIRPINANGDNIGGIVIFCEKSKIKETDEKIIETVGLFFEKQSNN